jgi:hypothetical protein
MCGVRVFPPVPPIMVCHGVNFKLTYIKAPSLEGIWKIDKTAGRSNPDTRWRSVEMFVLRPLCPRSLEFSTHYTDTPTPRSSSL